MKPKKLTLDSVIIYVCDTCGAHEEVRLRDVCDEDDLKDPKNPKLPLILCGSCPDGEIAPKDYPNSGQHLFDFEDD